MTIFTSRRFAERRAEATRQLIVFSLQQEWFALPIHSAYKVIPIGQIYGAPQGTGISLTHYQDQDIPIIDVKRQIFGETSSQSLLPSSPPGYLLIIQNTQGELIGIPLDSQPSLRRVPTSAFAPLPSTYLAKGSIRCVSTLVTPAQDQPSFFLLNLNQLVQLQPPALPAAGGTASFK